MSNYNEYLQSDEWKRKRNERVLYDGKCMICGRPFDLEVHHMTYNRLPNERYSDLITVCRNCHEKIESKKRHPGSDSFWQVRGLIAEQFCKDYESRDLSAKGDLDFCNIHVAKKYFYPYLREHGMTPDNLGGTLIIQEHFRNKRYEIILDYLSRKFPIGNVVRYTGFSYAMIKKVYDDPEGARKLMNHEKLNTEKKEMSLFELVRDEQEEN